MLNIYWNTCVFSLYWHQVVVGRSRGRWFGHPQAAAVSLWPRGWGGAVRLQQKFDFSSLSGEGASGTPEGTRVITWLAVPLALAVGRHFHPAELFWQSRVPWRQPRALPGLCEAALGGGEAFGPRPGVSRPPRLCSCTSFWLLPGTCRNRCGICWFCQTRAKHLFPSGVSQRCSCRLWKTCRGFYPQ